jgi:hypothetical protein
MALRAGDGAAASAGQLPCGRVKVPLRVPGSGPAGGWLRCHETAGGYAPGARVGVCAPSALLRGTARSRVVTTRFGRSRVAPARSGTQPQAGNSAMLRHVQRPGLAPRLRGSVLCVIAVVLAAGIATWPAAGTAAAHPSGSAPPHAWLAAEDHVVTIEFTLAPDDAAVIGSALGLLPEDAMEAYLGDDGATYPTDEEIAEFSASGQLRDYLLEHIEVQQDGLPCPGEAEPAADFFADGAELRFTCQDAVEEVDLRVTALHEQDPAYRTFSVDGGTRYAVHTAAEPQHQWDFAAAADGSGAADGEPLPVGLWAGLVAVIAGIAGVLGWWHRGSSRRMR